VVEQLIHVSKW